MTRKFTTAEEYSAFYGRVEAEFTPEEMTQSALAEWLRNDSLADTFALTREIAIQIDEAQTIEELKELQAEARLLTIHRTTLLRRIDDKAEGIVNVENFAKEKGINLGDKAIGRIEDWNGIKVRTIRNEKGHFKAWRKLK